MNYIPSLVLGKMMNLMKYCVQIIIFNYIMPDYIYSAYLILNPRLTGGGAI